MIPSPNNQWQLAAFVANTQFQHLPADLVARTKRHIIDTLGAGLVGASSQVAQDVCQVILAENSVGVAGVWGRSESTSARNAALLNGIAAHALELDDTGGCDHSGAVVLPALLAVYPLCAQPVSGEQFITAVVLGYDVARRVLEACGGYSAHNSAGWHSTSTCGVFGAAVAAAKILGMNSVQINAALGIAGSFSSGLWSFIHDGSQSKKLHAGRAAEGGVFAALSARQGLTGPGQLFEPSWGGFINTLALHTAQPEAMIDRLGQVWKLMRCSIKPYASCRGTHAAIDASGILFAQLNNDLSQVAQVEVRLCPFLAEMCGDEQITTLAAAQMSIRYAIAARLVFGEAGLDAYGDEQRSDPRLAAMIGRIHLHIDPQLSSEGEPEVTLVTPQGERRSLSVEIALGAPANPVSDEQLKQKFMSLAKRVIPPTQAEKLWALTLNLEQHSDIGEMVALLNVL